MKLHLVQVTTTPNRSFSVRQETVTNINNRWHQHAELELICFHRGSGTQFVGDSIGRFNPGDIVLVGANLPHYWHYDSDRKQTETSADESMPYATVIHFSEHFWGERFLGLPENSALKSAMEKARRGLSLTGEIKKEVASLINRLVTAEGIYRVMFLMECLHWANKADESSHLASIGFRYDASDAENERINAIYAYTLKHFRERISLQQIASVAGLSPSSFCRYFKSRTGKQFSQFLLEIRIGYSCKKLLSSNKSVKQICYESGFNNFTCYHKKFKLITGKTPVAYQSAFANSGLN